MPNTFIDTYRPSTADLASFREQGFFITPIIFDPQLLCDMRAAFDQMWQDAIAEAPLWYSPADAAYVHSRPFLVNCFQRYATCRRFFRHPSLVGIMQTMLGSDADLCYNQAVIKPASESPNTFAWHQDTRYAVGGDEDQNWGWNRQLMLDDRNTYQSWVAISDTNEGNGTLRVLPGSHRDGFPPYRMVREDHGEIMAVVDDSNAVSVSLQAGQMLVFSGMLLHASGANRDGSTRYVYQFCTAKPGARKLADSIPLLRNGEAMA